MLVYLKIYNLIPLLFFFFFFNDTATTEIYTLSLHDALPTSVIPHGTEYRSSASGEAPVDTTATLTLPPGAIPAATRARITLSGSPAGLILRSLTYLHRMRSEEHTSELQSPCNLVCRLLLEKK